MAGVELKSSNPDMERWKRNKQIKKAKKIVIKQLMAEGADYETAKRWMEKGLTQSMINQAIEKVKNGNN